MLATLSLNALTGHVPPPLRMREGQKINESAARDYNVKILAAESLDGSDWSRLALDVSAANKLSVHQFLEAVGVVAISLQQADLPLYFSDHILAGIEANWGHFKPGFQDVPPSDLADLCDDAAKVIWRYKPEEPAAAAPDSEWDSAGNYQGPLETRNEAYLEHARLEAEQTREAQEAAVRYSHPWDME